MATRGSWRKLHINGKEQLYKLGKTCLILPKGEKGQETIPFHEVVGYSEEKWHKLKNDYFACDGSYEAMKISRGWAIEEILFPITPALVKAYLENR